MKQSELRSRISHSISKVKREISVYTNILIYGSGIELDILLEHLSCDEKTKICGLIVTESIDRDIDIPIIEIDDIQKKTYDCIIIIDYIRSLYASNVLFKDDKVINLFYSADIYEKNEIVDWRWMHNRRTEDEILTSCEENLSRKMVNYFVDHLNMANCVLKSIEIETINRCNGECSFCPINKRIDNRILSVMDMGLFEKIIKDLADINYAGRLALFSNNEPLLDKRIVEFYRIAREKLPNCRLHMFTNGRLLTKAKFVELIEYLDELIIDNYSNTEHIPQNIIEIIELCKINKQYKNKVTVVMRREDELLTTRGGESPNRVVLGDWGKDKCALPFQQMVIRPTGEVSLCNCDPLGRYTLGNASSQTIKEIWNGDEYRKIRTSMLSGRQMIDKCISCDVFYYFY